MKKNYLIKMAIICVFFSLKISAQLNGAYTINNSVITGGTNFQTFTDFANALNTLGVSGPVTANVTNATYVEQVNFLQPTGISATNTITVNGNGATITFAASLAALPHTIMLSGADYMTFNNLNIVGTGGTYAMVVHLWNQSNNNTFNNCNISSPVQGIAGTQVPVSISGTSISPTASSNCGNDNMINGCTLIGGYYSCVFYGNSAAPTNSGNKIVNSIMRDHYYYGFYGVYSINTVVKNNIIENVNKSSIQGTRCGIVFSTGSQGSMIDGNHIRKLFQNVVGSTTGCYGIYLTVAGVVNQEIVVQNNVISDINSAGTIYGIYIPTYANINIYHNTISLDDATATGGATYGISAVVASNKVKNNIVTIGRAGAGTKYGMYYGTATTIAADYNDVYISSTAGLNYPFYLNVAYTSLGAFQTAFPTIETNSKDANPVYTNPTAMNYVPTSLQVNNMCLFIGVATDFNNFTRSLVSPDPGAYESYTTACTGPAPANSVLTTTGVVCPNSPVVINLANTFTNTGYSVQWQSAPALLGPYTAIGGASLTAINTNTLTTTTFYNALISCINGGPTVTAAPNSIQIAAPTLNTVPYNEGFEGISKTNELPNCSWIASNPVIGGTGSTLTYTNINTNNRIPRNGTKFATFAKTSANNYFFSNGIYMSPGITYSASVWYINESVGYTTPWDFAILVGQNQSQTGLTTIASTTNAALSYSSISNTFSVLTAGIYYMAVRGLPSGSSSPYLSWDDLQVIIPCSLNSPPLTLNASATTICEGQSVNFSAAGAGSYSWNAGQTTRFLTVSPLTTTSYTVVGTNTVSGCTAMITQQINVIQAPPVSVFASDAEICVGESTNLTAQGANTYNWAHGVIGAATTVTPNVTTTYSVIGVSQAGCPNLKTIVILVNPLPNVSGNPTSNVVCRGQSVTFNGGGASTYQWSSSNALIQFGNPLNTTLQSSGGFTVSGTDANGCVGKAFFTVSVEECTGINELGNSANGISVYPNPNTGSFYIQSDNIQLKSVEIFDVTGKSVYATDCNTTKTAVDLSGFSNGVYSVKVQSTESVRFIKIVKTN